MLGQQGNSDVVSTKKDAQSETLSTSPNPDLGTQRSTEVTRGRKSRSIVSQLKASLENKGGGVVLDLDDFYKSQKAKRVGDNLRKEEATQNLHSFRNLTPEKVGGANPRDKPVSPEKSAKSSQAADRAAAAALLGNASKRSSPSSKAQSPSQESLQAANRAAATAYFSHSPEKPIKEGSKDVSPKSVQFSSSAIARKLPKPLERDTAGTSASKEASEIAKLRASLEEKTRLNVNDVVVDLDEFYKKQKIKCLDDKKQRSEATQLLHNYQAYVALGNGEAVDVEEFVREQQALNVVKELDQQVATQMLQDYHAQFCGAEAPDYPVLVDYEETDYRAFLFVVHEDYGLLALHCTHKKDKGPHFQLPGGHIDDPEFVQAAKGGGSARDQLLVAAKLGAARELYEETGIDIRNDLDRLEPAALRSKLEYDIDSNELACQLKNKLYFLLPVTDSDFLTRSEYLSDNIERRTIVTCGAIGGDLQLRISDEHSGFTFAKNPRVAAEMIRKHSGGSGSEALLMSMNRPSQQIMKGFASTDASSTGDAADELTSNQDMQEVRTERHSNVPDLLPPPEQKGLFSCCFCT